MSKRNSGKYQCQVCGTGYLAPEQAALCQARGFTMPRYGEGKLVRSQFFYRRFSGSEEQNRFEVIGNDNGFVPGIEAGEPHVRLVRVRMLVAPRTTHTFPENELEPAR